MSDPMSPEELEKLQEEDLKELERLFDWLDKKCVRYRPLWERIIKRAQEKDEAEGRTARNKEEVGKVLADNAEKVLNRDENEIFWMVTRTSPILAAATLLFAVFALKSGTSSSPLAILGIVLLVCALLLTGVAFVIVIKPLAPPLKRAWINPYEKREYWTALGMTDFERWIMCCWLANRRTPVITPYKKAHSIAVRLLVGAALLTIPGLALSLIYR